MSDQRPKHLAAPAASGTSRWRPAALVLVAVVALGALPLASALRQPDRLAADAAPEPDVAATAVPPLPTPGPATASATTERGPLGSGASVTIAFAGDMNFEGANRARLAAAPRAVLAAIAPTLGGADLAIGNLETSLGSAGAPWPGKEFTFQAPASALDALRAAGFDAVSMANNHGMDFGTAGLVDSLAVARAQADRFVIGIGGDEAEAYRPFTAEVRGQRIAVIAATQVIGDSMIRAWTATVDQPGLASAKRVDRLVAEVADARASADTVVVFLHWGVERELCPSVDQQALAAALVEAGADVVVGGHAHRVQGGGRMGGAFVGYGLGNFLWNAGSVESATTGVLEVTITGRRVDRYRWVPARIEGGVPVPLSGAPAAEAVTQWDERRGCTGLTA